MLERPDSLATVEGEKESIIHIIFTPRRSTLAQRLDNSNSTCNAGRHLIKPATSARRCDRPTETRTRRHTMGMVEGGDVTDTSQQQRESEDRRREFWVSGSQAIGVRPSLEVGMMEEGLQRATMAGGGDSTPWVAGGSAVKVGKAGVTDCDRRVLARTCRRSMCPPCLPADDCFTLSADIASPSKPQSTQNVSRVFRGPITLPAADVITPVIQNIPLIFWPGVAFASRP